MPCGNAVRWVVGAAVAGAIAFFACGSSTALAVGECANEALRVGRSGGLPDCRAYEQVSPVDKRGADVAPLNEAVSVTGQAISYPSAGGFAGAVANSITNQYLSGRGPDGWWTEAITPPFENAGGLGAPQYIAFAPDLSHQLIESSLTVPNPDYLYRRNPDRTFSLINPGMPPSTAQGALRLYVGASDDTSRIYIKTYEQLTPDAPAGEFPTNEKLYYWDEGTLTLASVLPDGTPSVGTAGGTHPVSADGSRVYWRALQTSFEVPQYLSENGVSRLVTERRSDGAAAGAIFLRATRDGSFAYYTSTERLTEDASTVGADLYRYDARARDLVDLTPHAEGSGAAVLGVVGTGDDGAIVYFVAEGALAAGATAGRPNLYVHDGARTTFIATLRPEEDWQHPGDVIDWAGAPPFLGSAHAQVSADGGSLLFLSLEPLAPGYETGGHAEAYLYRLGEGLTCVSCNPGGTAAEGDATLTQTESLSAVNVQENFPVNNLVGGRRAFFETTDALLPTDTNGKRDVYEWERAGSGGCAGPANCLYLISSGRAASDSFFQGASSSGDDAFFLTRERLVSQDSDDNLDVYDARVGGGLASQNPPPPPPACETSEGCHGSPTAAGTTASIGSAGFVGPPDEKPRHKKARHRKHKRHHRHRRHKRHGKARHGHRPHADRRHQGRKANRLAVRIISANQEANR
jgi:hypothetical protein